MKIKLFFLDPNYYFVFASPTFGVHAYWEEYALTPQQYWGTV